MRSTERECSVGLVYVVLVTMSRASLEQDLLRKGQSCIGIPCVNDRLARVGARAARVAVSVGVARRRESGTTRPDGRESDIRETVERSDR